MYAAAHDAVERARAGEGPTLIEAMTFRFLGHVFGDDDAYMAKDEKARRWPTDPVPRFRARLIADRHRDRGAARRDRGRDRGARSTTRSSSRWPAPSPTSDELRRDVFAEEIDGMSTATQPKPR